jgi:hypothetical protein
MRIGWKPKSSDPAIASVRFRCLTPLAHLAAANYPIELFDPARDYTAVIFSKLYGRKDQALARALRDKGCVTLLDLSDNHFYNPKNLPLYVEAGADLRAMAERVDQVICCAAHLAEIVAKEANLARPPLVVGDAVEDLPVTARKNDEAAPFRILWFGSHGSPNAIAGMEDLRRIRPQLERAAMQQACELVVISNKREAYEALVPDIGIPSRYRDWSQAAFAEELARADLIVVPVTTNPFTLCKSNNRVATALWYAVPVLADRIPAYDDLAAFAVVDDWDAGFDAALRRDPALTRRTEAGRAHVREHFSGPVIAQAWRAAIETALDRAGAPHGVS